MRKLSADFIFDGQGNFLSNHVLELDDTGKIIKLRPWIEHESNVEFFEGILSPGLINSHCHMELSFMFEKIPTHTGLVDFVKHVVAIRDQFSEEEQQQAIQNAHDQMHKNGIVAVGDISNDPRSFKIKEQSDLAFHTFVEAFDLSTEMTEQSKKSATETYNAVPKRKHSIASVVPHAPYSVTPDLFKWINTYALQNSGMISIHMQEQKDENALFIDRTGIWPELFKDWGVDSSWFEPTGKNSLESVMQHFSAELKWLFIHNTNTAKEDIQWAKERNEQSYFCFCPNANLYIENTLPNYGIFLDANAKCVLGTDSLASNWQLSILSEMQTILQHAPYVPLEHLLTWATKNGADCLGFDHLGSFQEGKTPGVVLISSVSNEKPEIDENSTIRRIL